MPDGAQPVSMAGPLSLLCEWAVSVRAFRRNKAPVEKKVVAAALCNSGYSYRDVARMVGRMSHVAARDAYFSLLTSFPKEERKHRSMVSIDGSDVRVNGSIIHLWVARDVGSGEMMSFQASPDASAEDGTRFLASIAAQCANRPYLRLGTGRNRPRGLLNLDLYFQTSPEESLLIRLGRIIRGAGA